MTTVCFPGSLDSLERISEFVLEVAQKAGLDDSAIYAVQLAVDEAFTNIVEHGYEGQDLGEVECTCDVLNNGLQVMLRDNGPRFDPDSVPEPELRVPLEEIKSRGLGLFLMRKMMDEVKFQSLPEGGNVLIMIKRK
jgi:serine/threonine-protein kinase RsbW